MSENRVTWLFLIILVTSGVRYGTSLECYVCTSIEDSACTSSLSGIRRSTCSRDEIAGTTSNPSGSTTSSESVTTITTIADSISTTLMTETTVSSVDPSSESTSPDATSTELTSHVTEIGQIDTSKISPGIETTTESMSPGETTSRKTESGDAEEAEPPSHPESELLRRFLNPENNEPKVRMARNAVVEFACYTMTLIMNNETVTDRGCVMRGTSMCETINEAKYPGHNSTACTTCTMDGCNSASNNLSGIPAFSFPLLMFILMR